MKYLIALLILLSFNLKAVELNRNLLEVKINIYKTEHELQRAILNKGFKFDKFTNGFAVYATTDNYCEVFIVKNKKQLKTEQLLGHEIMHCMYGDFHK
jgi:hypothetical protein